MIPDGLDDPVLHLKCALNLKHPFDDEGGFKDMRRGSREWEMTSAEINSWRSQAVNRLRIMKASSEIRRRDMGLKSLGSKSFKKLGERNWI